MNSSRDISYFTGTKVWSQSSTPGLGKAFPPSPCRWEIISKLHTPYPRHPARTLGPLTATLNLEGCPLAFLERMCPRIGNKLIFEDSGRCWRAEWGLSVVILRQTGDMVNTTPHRPGRHPAPRQGHCPGSSAQRLPITSDEGHPSSCLAVSSTV